jgi:hypothetical protein
MQNLLSSSDPKSGGANKKVERIRAFLKGTVGFLFDPRSTWKAGGMADVEGEVYGGLDMGSDVGSLRRWIVLRKRDVAQASLILFRALSTSKTW